MPDIPDREALENKLARLLGKIQSGDYARLLDLLGDPPKLENVPSTFWDEVASDSVRVLSPFLQNLYLDQAKLLMDQQPIGIDWALVAQRAVDWAQRYTFDLVRGMNATSQQALRTAVGNYFGRGQTIGELQQSLVSLFGPIRAEAIAVTEVTRAAAEGEIAIGAELDALGVQMIATWNTNGDELVCPICRPLDGMKASGYEDNRRPYWIHPISGKRYGPPPSTHPRDRCWVNWSLPKK
jgi:hypothetical protein